MSVATASERVALLEREESLAILGALLDGVRSSGEGRLALVGGEAGVGKTALTHRFCEACRLPVLWGSCEPLLTPRPLGPLFDIAEAAGSELEALVVGGGRAHEVVAALMRELRRRGPAVLVLEDLHWADEATLDVFRLLARRIGAVPTIVLASYRDDELNRAQQLRILLGELAGSPTRLKVAPLSLEAVCALAMPHGVDGPKLYRTTGGNPFFVSEVLGAGSERIPETVRDAVLARAERLSPPARRLLDAMTVVPGHVELWLLGALAGELIGRLEECLGSGMLTATEGDVAFRHELARLAVAASVAPDRQVALHRAALAALAAPPTGVPDPARLAHHAEAIADAEGVLRWAPQAATRAASSGAHREAAAQYARALRFAEGVTPDVHADLLERRSYECFLTSAFDEAIDLLERALALRRELGDARRLGDLLASLARVLHKSGRTREAEVLAAEAVELLDPLGPTRELARAYSTRSQLRMVLTDLEATVRWGTAAIEIAERVGDTDTLVHALNSVGAATLRAGLPGGAEKLEASLELAQRAGLDGDAGRAFNNLVAGAVASRAYGLAERYVEGGIEYCDERGLDLWREHLLANRATLELHRGRWPQARDTADQLLRDLRSTPLARIWALVTAALLRARYGEPGVAGLLDEALALAEPTGELQAIGHVAWARAEAAWLDGKPEDVAAATQDAFMLALRRHDPWMVGQLACWRWRAGVSDDFPAGAAAEPYRLSIAGKWARAARLWSEIGCPYEAALALSDADDVLPLRRALDELQTLGARTAAAVVTRRLRERGVRDVPRGPRPRTRENPAGLTERELEVLALLAEGLRNRQIAQRLVVSGKTIDHHVSAVLRKLDVRTRGEAGAKALRLGLTQPDPRPPVKRA